MFRACDRYFPKFSGKIPEPRQDEDDFIRITIPQPLICAFRIMR
jgi:hypothetical protein